MDIAVLGLGSMGAQLASRLLAAGHTVTVWNRSAGKADDLVAEGATEVGSPAEAAAAAEALVLSLADDKAVEAVLLPDGSPLPGGSVIVNATTVSVTTTELLTQAYGERYVAAPILGAPTAVADGNATYVLGGPDAQLDRLAPLWEALSDKRLRCGVRPRDAATVKLVSNSLLLTGLAALGEAVATAQAAGLSADLVDTVFDASVMVAPGLRNRLADVKTGDHTDGWFAMPLGRKDLRLFTELAQAHGVDAGLANEAGERYQRAVDAGRAEDDVAGIVEVAREGR